MKKTKKEEKIQQVKSVLEKLYEQTDIVNLCDVYKFVAVKMNIDVSTIRKNEDYQLLCQKAFKNFLSDTINKEHKIISEIEKKYHFLENENLKLKNQLKALSNAIEKLPNEERVDELEYEYQEAKKILSDILAYFKDKLYVVDDKIIIEPNTLREKKISQSKVIEKLSK